MEIVTSNSGGKTAYLHRQKANVQSENIWKQFIIIIPFKYLKSLSAFCFYKDHKIYSTKIKMYIHHIFLPTHRLLKTISILALFIEVIVKYGSPVVPSDPTDGGINL